MSEIKVIVNDSHSQLITSYQAGGEYLPIVGDTLFVPDRMKYARWVTKRHWHIKEGKPTALVLATETTHPTGDE